MMSLSHQSSGFAQRQFGNYRLIKRIGQGGFADVYLAQHIYLHHKAVVKVLRASLSQKARQSFQAEASTIMSLDHMHIVRILDFGIQAGTPYIIMQWAANGSLRRMHPAGTRLHLATILHYAQQVADALTYLHQRNLIHQDIKPENMLLDANDNVLLADFGLAIMIDQTISQQSEEFVGTLAYTAPERFKGKYVPTPASDQYALAIVIYEWLAGRRPFQGSAEHIMQQHLYESPPPLRNFVPGIPQQVERVILKALQKEPEQRFSSIQAFIDALREAYKASRRSDARSTSTSSDSRIRALDGLAKALAIDLFISILVGVTASMLQIGIETAWNIFVLSTFFVPFVHAFVKKKRLEQIVVVSTMLLAVVTGITQHNLFLAWIIQFVLLAAISLSASLYSLCRSLNDR